LASDRHTLADQVGDVAIDGPLRGLELGRERLRGHRLRCTAQDLNDLKEPVGASHEPLSPDDADSMMAAGGGRQAGARPRSLPNISRVTTALQRRVGPKARRSSHPAMRDRISPMSEAKNLFSVLR